MEIHDSEKVEKVVPERTLPRCQEVYSVYFYVDEDGAWDIYDDYDDLEDAREKAYKLREKCNFVEIHKITLGE